ncbi:MAG: NusG domain II-containing protein [Lachnospiraceae bacterium]|nr:NusG domain II-containing protein [Lachnospiraceae bacterium]
MKKADFFIILIILLPALAGAAFLYVKNNHHENIVAEIYIAGGLNYQIPLSAGHDDILIHTGEEGYNILRFEADGVYMAEANCKSQTCVLSGKFSYPGQMIACLPHRILVRLTGKAEGGIDAIAY